MAKLTHETIKTLVQLSRIECSPDEQKALFKDLEQFLTYVELLDEVNIANIKPCLQVLEFPDNVVREDTPGEAMPREAFLANAPSQIGGMIRVPPVIKSH